MNSKERLSLSSKVINMALTLGADLCGIASVADMKAAPANLSGPVVDRTQTDRLDEAPGKDGSPYPNWPEDAVSIIVIALSHPAGKPEMDWWHGQTSPSGNKKLMEINKALEQWLRKECPDISIHQLPYHRERGGIFLKDTAVLAGLGCIGRNNLLVTPRFGSKVRLRALMVSEALAPTGPTAFDPCADCDGFCRQACPVQSFADYTWSEEALGTNKLPARDGTYCRSKCGLIMAKNEDEAVVENGESASGYDEACQDMDKSDDNGKKNAIIKYCRNCELSCPVGNI